MFNTCVLELFPNLNRECNKLQTSTIIVVLAKRQKV